VSVTIESKDGVVTLSGIVLNPTERAHTEQVAAAAPGVTSVVNQLRVMNKRGGG